MASKIKRILSHLIDPPWRARRAFPADVLKAVEAEIAASERLHTGELRFVVETGLSLSHLLRGVPARQRALEVFADLRIWDTEENSGVLIYLLLADRQVEILADRGIHRKVGDATWRAICRDMETAFHDGRFRDGAIAGVRAISLVLEAHFPVSGPNPDELPNSTIII
ncbi:MAG: TPM domain-containing protein [Propionivibrio sp.]